MKDCILLDGPMGTELAARGVATPLPGWSCHALETAPEVVLEVHRAYARAGAQVHTTNTFRTRPEIVGERWNELARLAVRLAREAAGAGQRVAGSIAPLADCYRPDLSPVHTDPELVWREHLALAQVLAQEGCDLLLCETFPCAREGLLALEAALSTGLECWLSFTPGPKADLLTPSEFAAAARAAASAGARAVLVNCLPAERVGDYLTALAREPLPAGVRLGAYANAGAANELDGWTSVPGTPELYAERALDWTRAGASILGGCCGTGPSHLAALAAALAASRRSRSS